MYSLPPRIQRSSAVTPTISAMNMTCEGSSTVSRTTHSSDTGHSATAGAETREHFCLVR